MYVLGLSSLRYVTRALIIVCGVSMCHSIHPYRLYTDDRNMFNQMAREWTWKYAMSEVQQVYFGHVDLSKGFHLFSAHGT